MIFVDNAGNIKSRYRAPKYYSQWQTHSLKANKKKFQGKPNGQITKRCGAPVIFVDNKIKIQTKVQHTEIFSSKEASPKMIDEASFMRDSGYFS